MGVPLTFIPYAEELNYKLIKVLVKPKIDNKEIFKRIIIKKL